MKLKRIFKALGTVSCILLDCVVTGCAMALGGEPERLPRSLYLGGGTAQVDDPISFVMLEARIDAAPNVKAAAAVLHLRAHADYETQLRLMVTGARTWRNWTVDNRHLLSINSGSVERYRSRLRAIRQGLAGRENLSLRIYDEIHVAMNGSGILRNDLAFGIGFQPDAAWNLELYRVWVDQRGARDSSFVLLSITRNLDWLQ